MEITLLSIPAIIVGLVEIVKRLGVPEKWLPVLDVGLGIGLSFLLSTSEIKMVVLQGIVLGLSAGGLYDLGKEPVTTVIRSLKA